MKLFTALLAAIVVTLGLSTADAAIIFDHFNVDEGHFAQAPNFSGSSDNIAPSSTADRVTTDSPLEGAGHQKLVFNYQDLPDPDHPGTNIRVRHLSGGGTPANNTSFTTSAAVDGWIGFYMKTTTSGYNAQIWLEGVANNGSVPKAIIGDGQWHLYEWNLDDNSGGADGWGAVAGIAAGTAPVENGSYTIDSIIFRNTTSSGTFFFDFLAKSDSGSIAGLLNTAPTVVNALYSPAGGDDGNPVNASDPGSFSHQFVATDTETPGGPFTWDNLQLVSYSPAYGGAGPGPAVAAGLSNSGLFSWNTVGSPRGIYTWSVRGTDPGSLSDTGTIEVHVTEVPEPASFALCGLAMVGAIGLLRRR